MRVTPSKYIGQRGSQGEAQVMFQQVNGEHAFPLQMRTDLSRHPTAGFEWGVTGSSRGSRAQLALAILASRLDDQEAVALYQDFKTAVVARLARERWELDGDHVDNIIAELRRRREEQGIAAGILDPAALGRD